MTKYTPEGKAKDAAYQKRMREKVISELGGMCAKCGTTTKLEFHEFTYPYGVASGSSQRRSIVKRLIREGNANAVTILCQKCHKEEHRLRRSFNRH